MPDPTRRSSPDPLPPEPSRYDRMVAMAARLQANQDRFHNDVDAELDRIASKVDAGEPVSVEPGGYQALTEDNLEEAILEAAMLRTDRYIPGDCDVCDSWHPEQDTCPHLLWQAGDPDPGFGRPPDIPDSWRWTTLGLVVAALAVWRWRHGR